MSMYSLPRKKFLNSSSSSVLSSSNSFSMKSLDSRLIFLNTLSMTKCKSSSVIVVLFILRSLTASSPKVRIKDSVVTTMWSQLASKFLQSMEALKYYLISDFIVLSDLIETKHLFSVGEGAWSLEKVLPRVFCFV